MESLSSCPACNTSLSLFTPRQISRHVNDCLDDHPQSHHPQSSPDPLPRCSVCQRDLTQLTIAARAEHENRCVDNLNPRPENTLSRVQSKLASTRSCSPPNPLPEDKRLRRFLELLGLDRYAQRFADEEIDFPALRLLEDSDFAHLRIPDAARRRIADALTAVPILGQIEGAQVHQPAIDAVFVPTQKFGTSRLARQMRRNKPMVQLDDSDGEYAPTPIVDHSPTHGRPITDNTSHEDDTAKPKETATSKDRSGPLGNVEPNCFEEIERTVKSGQVAPASESSDVSSFASDPAALSELLRSTSQITVELKLQKWRRKQIEKEKRRHERELQRIESEYVKLVKSTKPYEDHHDGKGSASPELPKFREPNCDTIDLTQDISEEENEPEASTTKMVQESIVISSNESILKASSIQQRNSQQVPTTDDACIAEREEESERDARTASRSPPRPESPFSETHTPELRKKSTSHEEVIDLISTEKKRGAEQPLQVAPSRSGNNIAPLFAPAPSRNDERGTQQNPSDSEDDFMDLLGVGKENTRSSSQPTHPAEDAHKRSSTDYDSSTTEEAPTQSRLKKRPKKGKRVKATAQDISELIRRDKALHEDILLMESVPLDCILSRLRGGQKHVTKKALYDFLQNEGIMFKGDTVEPGSQKESYLRLLNSDRCPD